MRRTLVACALVILCFCVICIAGAVLCSEAIVFALIACVFVLAMHLIDRYMQKRRMRQMASQLDNVLHNGRFMSFSDYSEGEEAVLSNELDKLMSKMKLLTEQLEAEKVALSDELADISHQIRTPLTSISLMVPLIEQSTDPDERKIMLHQLEGMIDSVSWLVSTLLKIAKADAGALQMKEGLVEVSEVVERALSRMEIQLDLRGIAVSKDIDEGAKFQGDAMWTAEALLNIIKNCMEHTPSGGVLSIKAKEDALATRITIEDSGPGIDPKDLPHLFERFYRGASSKAPMTSGVLREGDGLEDDALIGSASNRPTDPIEGFGIGLSLAMSLISAQGGTIRASNVTDVEGAVQGARFEVAFAKILV